MDLAAGSDALRRRLEVIRHHEVVRAVAAAAGDVPVHLVGGYLRDRLLGLPSHDFDVVVAKRGETIAAALARDLPARLVYLGGKDFAAFRLVGGDFALDLWDREGTSLAEDLARRDFTIDAVALDLADGRVIDPHKGLTDLERRLLRAVTPESFRGDPLRVLRLPRLVLQLPGFAAEPATLELARRAAPDLSGIASERIRAELAAILGHDEAHRGLALLLALDVYPGLWLGRPGESGPAGHAVRELECLGDCVRHLRELAGASVRTVEPTTARVSLTLLNLPAAAGPPLAALVRYREAGFLTHAAASRVSTVLEWETLPESNLEHRHFLHHAAELWPTALVVLGARLIARDETPRWRRAAFRIAELARVEGAAIMDPPRLIAGDEASRILRLPPGPELGRALAELRRAQVEGRVRSREEALALLQQL